MLGIAILSITWVWFGFVGDEPIFAQNLQVDKELYEKAETEQEEHAVFMFLYFMLYSGLIGHQTIWVQLCHVSRQKYQPFTKLLTFVVMALLISGCSTYFMEEPISTRWTAIRVLLV